LEEEVVWEMLQYYISYRIVEYCIIVYMWKAEKWLHTEMEILPEM